VDVVNNDQLNLDSSKMHAPLWQNLSLAIGQSAEELLDDYFSGARRVAIFFWLNSFLKK
jgi:pyrroloquinoline quinone (PQQ) biosynthesis protein C